jgi:hypothetical protein
MRTPLMLTSTSMASMRSCLPLMTAPLASECWPADSTCWLSCGHKKVHLHLLATAVTSVYSQSAFSHLHKCTNQIAPRLSLASLAAAIEHGATPTPTSTPRTRYINLDDGWSTGRNATGQLVEDKVKFPRGLPFVIDYIHSKGLKFGEHSNPL